MQIQCHHCGKSSTVGPTAKAALCPYCQGKLRLPGDSHDSMEGQVGFADLGRQRLSGRLDVHCTGCNRTFHVPLKFAGRNARCPECKEIIRIPALKLAITPAAETPTKRMAPAEAPPVAPETPVVLQTPTSSSVFESEPDFGVPAAPAPTPSPSTAPGVPQQHPQPIAAPDAPGVPVTPGEMAAAGTPLQVEADRPSAADVLGAISAAPQAPVARKKRRVGASLGWVGALAVMITLAVIVIMQVVGDEKPSDPFSADPLPPGPTTTVEDPDPDQAGPENGSADPVPAVTATPAGGTKPQSIAIVDTKRSLFAGNGFVAAKPGREFWRVQVTLMAHEDSIAIRKGDRVALHAGDTRGTLVGWIVSDQQLTPTSDALLIPKGASQAATFVFDMPSKLSATEGRFSIPGGHEITFVAPEVLDVAEAASASGEYYEIPPRNLRPIEDDPIIAALQNTAQNRLLVDIQDEQITVELPDVEATGEGQRVDEETYRVVLTSGGETRRAQVRLAGPDRVVLYLSDDLSSQLTFARGEAEMRLPPLPSGLVKMVGDETFNEAGGVFTPPEKSGEDSAGEMFRDSSHRPAKTDGFLDY